MTAPAARGSACKNPGVHLPITHANLTEWFPAPHTENPLAGGDWWQLQSIGLLTALQYLRLLPDTLTRQQALVELRRSIDTALLDIPTPDDEEIQRRMAQTLAPWCPSSFDVVEEMLDLADLQPREHLLDLGSGDGRICFAAARRGAYGRGIEIDARFVAAANERSAEDNRYVCTEFQQGRVEDVPWGSPDVVTCYLLRSSMVALTEKFRALRPGTRIISHAFPLPDWDPHRVVQVDGVPLYLWITS